MYKKILVPTDGSALSEKSIAAAVAFAKQNQNCSIVAFTVAEPLSFSPLEAVTRFTASDFLEKEKATAQTRVDHVAKIAKAEGVPCQTVVTVSLKPHEAILEATDKYQCDCIFMASNGRRGLDKLFVGSETQKVLALTKVPVLVYR